MKSTGETIQKFLWLVIPVGIILSGCEQITPGNSTSEPVSYITASHTPATQTPTPVNSPTPIINSPTQAYPGFAFPENVQVITELPIAGVNWSPTRNEFIGHNCFNPKLGKLYLANAPNFELNPISPEGSYCADEITQRYESIWTDDGEYIVWSSIGPEEIKMHDDVLISHRTGKDFKSLDEQTNGTLFAGWIDPVSLVVSRYTGGGTRQGYVVNILTNQKTHFPRRFATFYPPSLRYVPVQDIAFPGSEFAFDSVISLSDLFQNKKLSPSPTPFINSGMRSIQTSGEIKNLNGVHFVGWSPDRTQMLIMVWKTGSNPNEGEKIITALEMWNTNTNETKVIVRSGISGEISPDGTLLAFVSTHPLQINEQNLVVEEIRDQPQHMLYIMDLPTGTIRFEVKTETWANSGPNLIGDWWGGGLHDFIWSPDSVSFIHRNVNGHLEYINITKDMQFPLTLGDGYRVESPAWSFDGRYLSLFYSTREDGERFDNVQLTAILLFP